MVGVGVLVEVGVGGCPLGFGLASGWVVPPVWVVLVSALDAFVSGCGWSLCGAGRLSLRFEVVLVQRWTPVPGVLGSSVFVLAVVLVGSGSCLLSALGCCV